MSAYNRIIEHYFYNTQQIDFVDHTLPNIGTGKVGGNLGSGNIVYFQIEISKDGLIENTAYRVYGCGAAIACASWLSVAIKGLPWSWAKSIKHADIVRQLKLPEHKRHCAFLVEDALQAALVDLEQKQWLAEI